MSIMTETKKLLVPIVTPFKENGEVNYDALAKLTKKVLDDGADGIYATGSSAETFLLSTEEQKKSIEVIVKAANGAKVVAHVGSVGTKNAIDLAKHAEKVGADEIASVPPFYFKYGFAGIKQYYKELSESVSIPTLMYNIPGSTGVSLSVSELAEIMRLPKVESLKFTDTNYYMMQQVIAETGKFVYSGSDENFISAIAMGANGGIGTTYNFMVDKYVRIAKAYNEGKMDKALEIQKSANAITRACIESGTLAGTKYICTMQGIDVGTVRSPFAPLTEEAKKHIEEVYAKNINI